MTGAEWALVEPHLPAQKGLGRPRVVALAGRGGAPPRVLLRASPWRLLPGGVTHRSAVQQRLSAATVPTPAKSWRLLSLGMASGPSPSSSDRTRPRVFRCCHDAGWSSEPSPGSAATGGWPRTSKGPSRAARRGFILLPCSCWRAASLAHPQPLQVNYYYKQLLRFLTRH